MRGIVGVDDFLAGLATGDAAGHAEGVVELNGLVGTEPVPAAIYAQEFANGIAELVVTPLRVSGSAFVDIANGYALHVRLAQKTKHHARSLSSNSYESQIDFVIWRNVA